MYLPIKKKEKERELRKRKGETLKEKDDKRPKGNNPEESRAQSSEEKGGDPLLKGCNKVKRTDENEIGKEQDPKTIICVKLL